MTQIGVARGADSTNAQRAQACRSQNTAKVDGRPV